jgi:hypothetical protein
VFPLLFKALPLALKTKRGRRLLFLGALHAVRLARSDRARRAYAEAWRIASHPRTRTAAGKAGAAVRSAARRVQPRSQRKPTGILRVGHTVARKAAAVPAQLRPRR